MTEPSITIRAAHDSGPSNAPITRVVIHATCPDVGYSAASAPGAAHGTALYFQTPAAGGSAHYVCGVDREEHCVPEKVIAWHAPPNKGSLGIEITAEGGKYARNYSRDQWLSPLVWPAVQRAADRCRDLCDRYGIPKVKLTSADLLAGRRGICGHVDVSNAWHQTTHTDPGPNFPWVEFMAAVNQEDDMPSADEIAAAVWNYSIAKRGGFGPGPAWVWLADGRIGIAGVGGAVAALAKASDVDESALAAALVGPLTSALTAAVQKAGGLTQEQAEAACEEAVRNVLSSVRNPAA